MHPTPSSESPRALRYDDPRLARLSEPAFQELRQRFGDLLDAALGMLVEGGSEDHFLSVSGLLIARIVRLHEQDKGK